ncbi:glycosyltransferase family 2 protein [Luteimonas vadosa]|uniref:glycosyltransferase family 2 protein n=1 Tax=Luteimonas vadosa TaxID=1165507 RepID=UPI0031EFB565
MILTLDESENLRRCLPSVAWCDDIVVMDSGSRDDTAEVARKAGARVITRDFDSFAGQRNHAMESGGLRHRWTLHLDADEVVTPGLREEMVEIAREDSSPFEVYRVPSRLMLMGSWLRHAGMYPSYQVRFGRTDRLRFVDHGHGQREVQPLAKVGTLTHPLDHYNFSKGFNDWFARHLRYARQEALQNITSRESTMSLRALVDRDPLARRRAIKHFANRLPARPWLRFLHAYVLRLGFLDGRAGFHYAVMLGIYQYFIDLNAKELGTVDDR